MSVIGLCKHSKDASYLQVIPDHETIFSHHTLCLSKAFYFANGTIQHREIRMIFFQNSGHILHLNSLYNLYFLAKLKICTNFIITRGYPS